METIKYIFNKYNLIEGKSPYFLNITRNEMAKLFGELGFSIGAEIGVEQGLFSEVLCKSIPNLKLNCIDAWKAYKGYRDHTNQQKLNKYYSEATERLKPYNCNIIKQFSMKAVRNFQDNSLDFVYIDGNHDFQNVTNDIAEWIKKVRKGGILAGHDYVRTRSSIECQVKDVVDSWTHAYKIHPWFVINGDEFASWMLVK